MRQKDSFELSSILVALKPALKSIDIRTVAVKTSLESDWQNLITSVFMTEKTVDEIRKQQEKIPHLRDNNVAFFLKAIPFDYTLIGNIENDREVKFATPFGFNNVQFRKLDLSKFKVSSTQQIISGSYRWILHTIAIGSQNERAELWNIANDNEIVAKRQGFPNIGALARNWLKIEYSNGSQKDFELVIPSLASIESKRFIDSKFEIRVKKVSSLTDLQLNLSLARNNINLWTKTMKVREEQAEPPNAFTTITEVLELEDLKPYDSINVELTLGESALTLDNTCEFAPFSNVVEPFMKAFGAFCPLKKLKSMLLEPHKHKKPDRIFENAVTWLLSLAGYNPLHLGQSFEKCYTETKFEVGSADIIAYEECKRIFLIDCDTGPIDPRKIQQLIELGKYFSESFKEYPGLEIVPILVTPKKYEGQPKSGVRIVDSGSLERIFEELAKGELERARAIFCEFGY